MRLLSIATIALAFGASAALAQAPAPTKVDLAAGQRGLITATKPVPVTLVVNATGLAGTITAGKICNLQPNDRIEVVAINGDAVLVKRLLHVTTPSADTCPRGSLFNLSKASAEAAILAKAAADAAKAAKRGPVLKRQG